MKTYFPSDLKCVVLLGVDFDGPCHEVGRGIAPLGIHSWGRYSAKRGVPRHLEMFQRLGVPCTFFVPGYDAEQYPDLVKAIDSSGCEVAAHGYLHEAWEMPFEEEEALLRKTNDILGNLLGKQVLGWRSPSGRKSDRTMQVLKSMGYIYDSSDKDYDLPYRLRFSDGAGGTNNLIELPNNTYSLDDFPFYKFSHTPPSEVRDQWIDEFEHIYNSDGFFVLTVHPRSGWGSGTPSRSRAFEEVIRHIQQYDGVRFFSCAGFAQWCLANPHYLEEACHT
ncbi:polysaccharide deacetylase family protein [Pollutimonas sp. H1-120]|uniref:polysaccharide deacetylase family protein n=1 Tax=Pollutimonas sp. H1-120 TaxID=3148824 RepID=UPI003B515798